MYKAIYFDMDGTIADLYGVDGWLESLMAKQTKPYREAKPLVNMRKLAYMLNFLQLMGYHVGIVSWLSKSGTAEYDKKVTEAKLNWLKNHLGSVQFDEIKIIPYGTPKATAVDFPSGLLFDDEAPNRENWLGKAENVTNILEILSALIEKG